MSIVAPPGAQPEVGDDVEVATRHVGGHGLGVVGDVDRTAAHLDAAVGDPEQGGVEVDAARSEVAGDAAPVGVLAVPRALHQLAAGHGPGTDERLLVGVGPDDLEADDLGGAFGVAGHLPGQVGAGRGHGGVEGGLRHRAGEAAGEQQHGVVGGGAAVDVEGVEGVGHAVR